MVRPRRIESSSPAPFRTKPAAHTDGAALSERLTNVRQNSTNQTGPTDPMDRGPHPRHTEPSTSGSEKPLTALAQLGLRTCEVTDGDHLVAVPGDCEAGCGECAVQDDRSVYRTFHP